MFWSSSSGVARVADTLPLTRWGGMHFMLESNVLFSNIYSHIAIVETVILLYTVLLITVTMRYSL